MLVNFVFELNKELTKFFKMGIFWGLMSIHEEDFPDNGLVYIFLKRFVETRGKNGVLYCDSQIQAIIQMRRPIIYTRQCSTNTEQ